MKTPSTKKQEGPANIKNRFDALFRKANSEGTTKASERDIKALRDFMDEHEGEKLWQHVVGPGQAAIDYLLQQRIAGGAMSEAWREQIADMNREMGYDTAPPAEQMLISHVVLCWLQLNFIELKYADILGGARNVTLDVGRHWDRRVTLAQKRFTRAVAELERLRALSAAARYARARADEAEQRRQPPASPPALSNEERAQRVAEILERGRERPGPRSLTA